MNTRVPEVSAWYQRLASGNLFEVVAIDEASAVSNTSYLMAKSENTTVPAGKCSIWPLTKLLRIGSGHMPSAQNQAYSDQTIVPKDFSGPLTGLEPALMDFGDDF